MDKKKIADKILLEADDVVQQLSALETKPRPAEHAEGPTPQDALRHARLCLGNFLNFLVRDDFQREIRPSQWEDTIDLSLGDILDMNVREFEKFTQGKNLENLNPIEQTAYAYRTAMIDRLKKVLNNEGSDAV